MPCQEDYTVIVRVYLKTATKCTNMALKTARYKWLTKCQHSETLEKVNRYTKSSLKHCLAHDLTHSLPPLTLSCANPTHNVWVEHSPLAFLFSAVRSQSLRM